MNGDADELLRRWSIPVTLLLASVAIGSFIASVAYGAPKSLPGVALGLPLLLHLERALAITVAFTLVLMFLLRGWRGDFPRKLTTGGAEWPDASEVIAGGLAERLASADREARAVIEQFRAVVEQFRRQLEPTRTSPTREEGFAALDTAIRRWDEAISESEQRARLAESIARLPEREKLVVALRYYEDLPTAEIAGILGMSELQVGMLERRALSRLKEGGVPLDEGQSGG